MSSGRQTEIEARVMALAALLRDRGMMLATAESCTGGWVAKACTDLPGSSHWFERGFVTYTNESKQEMLGVSPETLLTHGAVSEATVAQMARGALAQSRAQCSVAISGIAGPGGGSAEKPVGTVCFAWAVAGGEVTTERCHFDGGREAVRGQAVAHALQGLITRLQ
ncbi:MAG: nicotinamide-nucleotide amidohydrolase family protein [Gammaproteobacteria bacterium]|nr:nicotinamide-nucleotide amidohydrolase family protein [Gammaproteobacteria bacterium]